MKIHNKKEFYGGAALMAAFIAVLVLIFSPVFDGKNGLAYMDDLYNSISKASAYYIPKLQKRIDAIEGRSISVALRYETEDQARESAQLFMQSAALVNINGSALKVSGDAGRILSNCLRDADIMYRNNGELLTEKYRIDARRVLFNWWTSLKSLEKALSQQKEFKLAAVVTEVVQKGVENSYNYYGIAPQKISDRFSVVLFSLIFYVVYTLWYGFAILFLFEGWGMQLGH